MTPTATYRLQFRGGMGFERAASLTGYLKTLGISHLYASPLFAAAEGSTHGYDAVSAEHFEPAIGGDEGFAHLSDRLRDAGIGLILDFVPNHMAAAETNPWWLSVLEWGAASPYAHHFDIDWRRPKLILPILGASYGAALREGLFSVVFNADSGAFHFRVYGRRLPLLPPSYAMLLERLKLPQAQGLARDFATATVEEAVALKGTLARLAAEEGVREAIEAMLADLGSETLHRLHELQVWRLAHWRLGREALTYRRFFEITDLICMRVEDPAVFDTLHARLLALIAEGRIDGVRIDHVDGLADPKGYLQRLQAAAGPRETPLAVLVEKILEREEPLRSDWPIAGTTGYEFIGALAGVFVDRSRETAMTDAYVGFTGDDVPYERQLRDCKRAILRRNLASDLGALVNRAGSVAAKDLSTRDFGYDSLAQAIVEIIAALPVYRTYIDRAGVETGDRALIRNAARGARAGRRVDNPDAIDFIERLLLLDPPTKDGMDETRAFVTRFQQASGPVMAKGAEDTLFYRYNRLIGLNEVGGAPDRYGASPERFHAEMARRVAQQPAGLSATATHDTKRGEDARARLYALSEMPEDWRLAVERWSAINAAHRTDGPGGTAPDPADEWLFYQALAGAWPLDLDADDPAGFDALRSRMGDYMMKALREAKRRTSWTDQQADYERAVTGYVAAALSEGSGGTFLSDFTATCEPLWRAGAVNGLAQLAIKLMAPGVPDIYQGTEVWDFSLVDPDNRRPVDFDARRAMAGSEASPEELLGDWRGGAPKMALLRAGLGLRAEKPALFAQGAYRALEVSGPQADRALAFARIKNNDVAVLVVPRLPLALLKGASLPLIDPQRWQETAVELPEGLKGRRLIDRMTGEAVSPNGPLPVSSALSRFPVAILANAE